MNASTTNHEMHERRKAKSHETAKLVRVISHRLRVFRGSYALLSGSSLLAAFILFSFQTQVCRAAGVWTKQKSGTLAWLNAVYFLDSNRGWAAGTSGTLLQTTDGGENWKALRKPTEDTIRDLHFADDQNGWLVCERSIYLLKTKEEQRSYLMSTNDGGVVWRRVSLNSDPDARLLRVMFTPAGQGWVFGEGGMLFSTANNGAIWTKKRAPTRHILFGGAFLDQTQMWLVGSGATVLQSRDGGETWRNGNVLGITQSIRFTATSFVDRSRGWAVGDGGRIFLTVDGGRTWDAQRSPVHEDLNDVKFIDAAEGWAVGKNGLLMHTTNGGFKWTIEDTGITHPLERLFFINNDRGWLVGFGGTIFSYAPGAKAKPPSLKQAPVTKRARVVK
jgi:photosystem II stability/assembly factor-like uncharacterized protein